jgi:hypothetical protein
MVQQVAHGHPIVDQRKFIAEHLPDRQIEVDGTVSDGRQHTECGQGLGAAGDPEAMRGGVRDTVCAVRMAICACDQVTVALDAHHSAERVLGGEPIEVGFHPEILPRTFLPLHTIGGGTRSAELTLPGDVHDVCAAVHALGVDTQPMSLDTLGEHGLHWVWPAVPLAHSLDGGRAEPNEYGELNSVVHLA